MTVWLPGPATSIEATLARWRQLAERADEFFGRVAGVYRDQMRCGLGCAECCHPTLTLARVEALAVLLGLSLLEEPALAPLRLAAADPGRERCPLLAPNAACAIYPLRPLICRTHGLPVLQEAEVSACPLNFKDSIPDDAVLDGNLLATQLGLVDALAAGNAPAERVSVAALVLEGAAALGRRSSDRE